jgi:hypothetical protein
VQTIMPKEDFDNWFYFLSHFREAGLGVNIKFFMSDCDKGLMAAVSHLFVMKFGKVAKAKLTAMARSYTVQGYNKYQNNLLLGKRRSRKYFMDQ